MEKGGPELLREVDPALVRYSTDHADVADSDLIILTVGTPVDEHLNPKLSAVREAIDQIKGHLHDGQILVLRSTLFPGTSASIAEFIKRDGLEIGISFCPERIAQGNALEELQKFPQIVSASDPRTMQVVSDVFATIASEIVELEMTEAELAKLFTNSWRYIRFAVANQFYAIATEKGHDFYRIRDAMTHNYPRAADFPIAGFAAGPCLFKDTMQLAAYNRQNFPLGHAAMLVNETLPELLVDEASKQRSLAGRRVGILGMAFKVDNDDHRESLAYKLRKLLRHQNAEVQCSDPYIKNPDFVNAEELLRTSEIVFIGCPHTCYRDLDFSGVEVMDCWGFVRKPQS